jgi:hypothetical protein
VFTDEARTRLHPDKGYAGVLYANPRNGNSAQLSLGRQTWTLNTGFLISMISGSANIGERGASYLGPRNTTDFSAIFQSEFGRSRVSLFYINPDELEDLESNTTFAGANFGWRFTDAFSADVEPDHHPATSDSSYRTPDRRDTLSARGHDHLGPARALPPGPRPNHFWLEGEAYPPVERRLRHVGPRLLRHGRVHPQEPALEPEHLLPVRQLSQATIRTPRDFRAVRLPDESTAWATGCRGCHSARFTGTLTSNTHRVQAQCRPPSKA